LKNFLKASGERGQTKEEDGFKEVRSRKRHLTGEAARTPKKAALPTSTVTTKNFAPSDPNNIDVCDKLHPVAETTERCGPTKLRVP
jgi:hypothetical protein